MPKRKCKYCKKAMRYIPTDGVGYFECFPCSPINGTSSKFQQIA